MSRIFDALSFQPALRSDQKCERELTGQPTLPRSLNTPPRRMTLNRLVDGVPVTLSKCIDCLHARRQCRIVGWSREGQSSSVRNRFPSCTSVSLGEKVRRDAHLARRWSNASIKSMLSSSLNPQDLSLPRAKILLPVGFTVSKLETPSASLHMRENRGKRLSMSHALNTQVEEN